MRNAECGIIPTSPLRGTPPIHCVAGGEFADAGNSINKLCHSIFAKETQIAKIFAIFVKPEVVKE